MNMSFFSDDVVNNVTQAVDALWLSYLLLYRVCLVLADRIWVTLCSNKRLNLSCLFIWNMLSTNGFCTILCFMDEI